MATSGTFTASMGNYYDLVITWSVSGQDIANNRSTVALKYGTKKKKSGATSYNLSSRVWAQSGSTYHLNGTTWGWDMRSAAVGDTYYFYSGTVTVNHSADGTGSLYVYGRVDVGSLTYASSASASGTITLPTIPRATTPKLNKTSADMGTAVTISLSGRAVSSFTHTLTYKLPNGTTGTIAFRTASTSVSWTVPDFAASLPNAVSGAVTVTCTTYDASGTKIGSAVSVTLTATVPASVVPTISAVSVKEAVAGIAEKYGGYIQSKSKLAVTITAAGAKGSTVKSVSSTADGKVYSGTSWTSNAIGGSGTVNIVTTVTDSRGRTAKKTTAVSVLAYSAPVIRTFTAVRCDQQGKAADDGSYALVRYAYSAPSLNGGNTAQVVIRAKQASAANYNITLLEDEGLTADKTAAPGEALSNSYRWDIQITVADGFGAKTTAQVQLPTAEVIMDFRANGLGMAIGKASEQDGLDIKWPVTMRQGMTANGDVLVQKDNPMVRCVNSEANKEIRMYTTGTNRGLYDVTKGKWLIGYNGSDDPYINGIRVPEIQCGSLTVSVPAGSNGSAAVTFSRTFSGSPQVALTMGTTSAIITKCAVTSVSATGFTANARSTASSDVNVTLRWIAMYAP